MSIRITSLDQLREHYPNDPLPTSLAKEAASITPLYGRLIEASPFCVVATIGPDGVDCSPRGDGPGFVRIRDRHTLEIPHRRGNNRLDTLHKRAIMRSGLWDPARHVDRASLPTAGMLTEEQGGFTAEERAAYDATLAERQAGTLY